MLKIVHISDQVISKPKKLTAKQRQAQELELFMAELRRDRRKAADKMTDSLKTLLK